MAVAIDDARTALAEAREVFTEPELCRLMWVDATLAAERCLLPPGQACPDHQSCRRLAFGLWLRVTRRVSEDLEA